MDDTSMARFRRFSPQLLTTLALLFLTAKLIAPMWLISGSSAALPYLLLVTLVATSAFFYYRPEWSKFIYGFFGLVLFLFGHKPDSTQSLLFEALLVIFTIVTLSLPRMRDSLTTNTTLLLVTFSVTALTSLMFLPWETISGFVSLQTILPLLSLVEHSSSHSYLYSLKGVLRLVLFSIFILALASRVNREVYLEMLVKGAVIGAVCSCIIGIIDYYGIISLLEFRQLDPMVNTHGRNRLHSTFGHPGWFAQFATVAIPYILYGFINNTSKYQKILLLLALVVCEIALILAQARSGWVAYPITLIFCWIFFYFLSGEKGALTSRGKNIALVLVSIPLTIAVSVLLVLGANKYSSEGEVAGPTSQIVDRAQRVLKISDRTTPWIDGINVGRESPLVGMGYQSYRWHADNLVNIDESILRQTQLERGLLNKFPTEHNFYITTFTSVGLLGCLLWAALCLTVSYVLIRDTIVNKTPENIPYLLSLISFHIYGFAQSMQYIPVIWFLVFLPFARAIIVSRRSDLRVKLGGAAMIAVLVYVIVAIPNFNSNHLKEKYQLDNYWNQSSYAIDFQKTLGMFHTEKWSQGQFTWTGKFALIRELPIGLYKAAYHVSHNDLDHSPLTLSIKSDTASFEFEAAHQGFHELAFASHSKHNAVLFEVDRTFQPSDYGAKDSRLLGIALGEIEHAAQIGMYQLEGHGEHQFRWTTEHAALDLRQYTDQHLVFWVAHPDVAENPVSALFRDEKGVLVAQMTFDSSAPQSIRTDSLAGSTLLHIEVDRVWQPGQHDGRKLGLAFRANPI